MGKTRTELEVLYCVCFRTQSFFQVKGVGVGVEVGMGPTETFVDGREVLRGVVESCTKDLGLYKR